MLRRKKTHLNKQKMAPSDDTQSKTWALVVHCGLVINSLKSWWQFQLSDGPCCWWSLEATRNTVRKQLQSGRPIAHTSSCISWTFKHVHFHIEYSTRLNTPRRSYLNAQAWRRYAYHVASARTRCQHRLSHKKGAEKDTAQDLSNTIKIGPVRQQDLNMSKPAGNQGDIP